MNDDQNDCETQALASMASVLGHFAKGDHQAGRAEMANTHKHLTDCLAHGRKAASIGAATAGRIMAASANAGMEGQKPI